MYRNIEKIWKEDKIVYKFGTVLAGTLKADPVGTRLNTVVCSARTKIELSTFARSRVFTKVFNFLEQISSERSYLTLNDVYNKCNKFK